MQLSIFDTLTTTLPDQPEISAISSVDILMRETAPLLPWRVIEATGKRTCRGQIKNGWIVISMPKRWPKSSRDSTIENLRTSVQAQFNKDWTVVAQWREDPGDLVHIETPEALSSLVQHINQNTLQERVSKIRIGDSRYSRLAQMNIRDRVLTVSKHCLDRVPEAALRYLIVHELAHLRVPNHSAAFWAQVKPFVPDYPRQSKIMQAFHRIRVYEAEMKGFF